MIFSFLEMAYYVLQFKTHMISYHIVKIIKKQKKKKLTYLIMNLMKQEITLPVLALNFL